MQGVWGWGVAININSLSAIQTALIDKSNMAVFSHKHPHTYITTQLFLFKLDIQEKHLIHNKEK